jgi:hypothetical protein
VYRAETLLFFFLNVALFFLLLFLSFAFLLRHTFASFFSLFKHPCCFLSDFFFVDASPPASQLQNTNNKHYKGTTRDRKKKLQRRPISVHNSNSHTSASAHAGVGSADAQTYTVIYTHKIEEKCVADVYSLERRLSSIAPRLIISSFVSLANISSDRVKECMPSASSEVTGNEKLEGKRTGPVGEHA